jgi:hypothetical protein
MLVLAVHLFGRVRRSWLDPAALGLATTAMLLTFIGINLLK